ncbi:MAG: ribosome biogenesis GTP-binding protein YihA/YsxC [Christensenellaceae bacterium]|jgi:GTP-binding protein|nr:ribosome biogenesis GTP-binding protein YihA/YsxC [Christensenellaceae bacterium]
MVIKQVQFITSVGDIKQLPVNEMPEIAIAGRSNVGKSSFINYITNNSKLAYTSKTPGRTRLLNYYLCNNEFNLVDLPGYGFAKVPRQELDKWRILMENYFSASKSLKLVFVLIDVRRDPNNDDITLVNYLHHYAIPFTIVVTKSDKLSKMQVNKRLINITSVLGAGRDNAVIMSALKKIGKDEILAEIYKALTIGEIVNF